MSWGAWALAIVTATEQETWSLCPHCCCSVTKSCLTLWPRGLQHPRLPCPSPSQSLLKLVITESVMPSNHLTLCHPLLLHSIFPRIGVFSSELALHIRWPESWNLSLSVSLSNEYSGLIFFRMDWFAFLAVQATLKRLLQHCSSKAPVLWCSTLLWSNSHIHTWLLEKP